MTTMTMNETKFSAILDGAGRVFGRMGYRRAMMSDIADESGVALGTLYRYSDSKGELFELALRRALGQEPVTIWGDLHGGGFESSLLAFVQDELDRSHELPLLLAAANGEDDASGLRGVTGELYDAMVRLRVAIRMIDRSASDWPELASLYSDTVRKPVVDALVGYLTRRSEEGTIVPPPDIAVAARFIVETCATFAMHRHFTPGGNYASEETARDSALHFVTAGFERGTGGVA